MHPYNSYLNSKWHAVSLWLFVIAGTIILMVVVGGLTRLTGSGLSITEWKPLHGAIPPLNLQEWLQEFEAYKKIPQFKLINSTMTLDEFKGIFWWEWGHRQLGRLLGIIFFIPMIFFWYKNNIPQGYKPVILALFLGGGVQGLVGWLMVKSGLVDRVSVSQYRLALHLGLALILYYWVLHTAIFLYERRFFSLPKGKITITLTILVFMQIISGAFTAGTHAGYIYNTWPLMDNVWIPKDLFSMGILSLFEDVLTIQFIHRLLAMIVFFMASCVAIKEIKNKRFKDGLILWCIIAIQVIMGIITLVTVAPLSHIELAAFHQLGAVIVLSFCCYLNTRILINNTI